MAITDCKCWYCGEKAETGDHGIPLSRGGSKKIHNLYPACVCCNQRKGTLTIDEFRELSKVDKFWGEERGLFPPKKDERAHFYKCDPRSAVWSLAEKIGFYMKGD
jgi:HNH endonuclease